MTRPDKPRVLQASFPLDEGDERIASTFGVIAFFFHGFNKIRSVDTPQTDLTRNLFSPSNVEESKARTGAFDRLIPAAGPSSDANGNKRRYVSACCLSALIVMTIVCAAVGWAAPNLISRTLTRDSQELAVVEAELAFFITFFGEWGDKSQIATIGLAAAENPRAIENQEWNVVYGSWRASLKRNNPLISKKFQIYFWSLLSCAGNQSTENAFRIHGFQNQVFFIYCSISLLQSVGKGWAS
ncbi:hypothetical protein L2E82_20423 [Cichorium intybus]|uniref:Uncharacterized protein n=1 Tax=Cichorium intybus TaxID=13427 RepID=A0ACB9DTC2_CICIN|nr:hypothetical protein L2E82_20423 [Cichorium intybus]